MKNRRYFTWARSGYAAGRVTAGTQAEKTGGVKPLRWPFLLRWVFAVSTAMLIAGLVQFALAQHQILTRSIQDSQQTYTEVAEQFEDILATDLDTNTHAEQISSEIGYLARSRGTEYVGLYSADGQLIQGSTANSTHGNAGSVDSQRLAEVASTRTATVNPEMDEGSGVAPPNRFEFLIPVSTPEGLLILKVDQRAQILTDLLDDLALRSLWSALLGILIAVPLSYGLGGRTLHRHQVQAQQEADADSLTGLASRRPFRPALQKALTQGPATTVTMVLIDLDGFKQINDRLGHSHGDRVLVGLAESFKEMRAMDTAFRLGGDEFAVILVDSDEHQSTEVLARVRTALTRKFPAVTFSAGIASSTPTNPVELQELWERADAALYEAKRRGRRQSVTFQSMSTGHTLSAEKIDALTELIANQNSLSVAFQPIWDLRRGVVLGHEALLRLPTDCLLAGPQEAFDLAERLGLAATLDTQARETILTAVKNRQWEGLLFLNVHPTALAELDLELLIATLTDAGLEPQDIVLEITEQAGLDQPGPISTLSRSRERGFRLALDDMGRSNAGLKAMTLVRFDIIKIDEGVISQLGTNPLSAAIVAAAMTYVEQTGGWVVAEGIEEQRSLAALLHRRELNSTWEPLLAGQGYLLGRPAEQPIRLDAHLSVLGEHPPLEYPLQ